MLRYNSDMQINDIVAALDSEILRLQQVKALLSGSTTNGKAPSALKNIISQRKHAPGLPRHRKSAGQMRREPLSNPALQNMAETSSL
jgi:hypothetical protein